VGHAKGKKISSASAIDGEKQLAGIGERYVEKALNILFDKCLQLLFSRQLLA
jgi:hypothetical protein